MRRFFLLVFFAATLRADEVLIGPTPAWVQHLAVDTTSTAPKDDIRYGIYTLLDDHQIRVRRAPSPVAPSPVEDYRRRVEKVLSSGGVQNASELSIDFDPTFETVVLHSITLLRDGKTIDQLPRAAIRVIDKEDESADRIYDGTRSALVILNDVRPGDVLDYSYSIDGANPILGGKFVADFDLTSSTPARLIRHRLIAARKLRWSIEPRREGDALIWEKHDVAPIDVDDQLPSWFDPYEHVQVTEFASWAEVGQWAETMFRIDEPSRAAVRELAKTHKSVTAAIRFVQDDIRYLGIEMGRNSHEPHQPAEVLEQRWGDCKDKSLLLAAMLRELGIEAYPAMVSTKRRHELDADLPSPFAFDHVITQVIANGKTYWVDGTLSDQGGTLETIDTPNDERALVVRLGTKELTTIDVGDHASTLIDQAYTVSDYASPVTLDIVTTYRGGDADLFRASLVSDSLTDIARDRLNRYAADHPKIEALGMPKIADDRDRNVITVQERYRIRELWKSGEWSFTPHAIENHLQLPDRRIRTMPLAFDFPLDITQRIVVKLPDRLDVEGRRETVETSAFRFDSELKNGGNTIAAVYHLHALRDGVPAVAVADHLIKINDVRDALGVSIDPQRDAPLLTKARRTILRHIPAVVSIALLASLIFVWIRRRRASPATV